MTRNVDIVAIIVLLIGLMVVAETRNAVSVAGSHFHISHDSRSVFVIPEAPRPPLPALPRISFWSD